MIYWSLRKAFGFSYLILLRLFIGFGSTPMRIFLGAVEYRVNMFANVHVYFN